jgi:putative transposase
LGHLSDAWKDCFKKKKGRPKFKKKGRNDSFTLDGTIKTDHFKIQVPKIGWLKTYERLPQDFIPKSVTMRECFCRSETIQCDRAHLGIM